MCRYTGTAVLGTFTLSCWSSGPGSVQLVLLVVWTLESQWSEVKSNSEPSRRCLTETMGKHLSILVESRGTSLLRRLLPEYVTTMCAKVEQSLATCSCGLHDSLFCTLHRLDGNAIQRIRTEAYTEPISLRCRPPPKISLKEKDICTVPPKARTAPSSIPIKDSKKSPSPRSPCPLYRLL